MQKLLATIVEVLITSSILVLSLLDLRDPSPAYVETLTETCHAQTTLAPSLTGATNQGVANHTVPSTTASPLTTPTNTSLQDLRNRATDIALDESYFKNLSPCTPVQLDVLAKELLSHPDSTFVSTLLSGFKFGFHIGYEGPRFPRSSPNLKTANAYPEVVDSNLLKELKAGHTAGPFFSPPYPNFQTHPIGLVPKKHSSEWRTIFHLSYPKYKSSSLNDHISKEDFSLQYVKIDDAINMVLSLGQGCFMAKTDIQSAFRIIPVHPSDWELLGMKWRGLYFFDKVLPFGLRSAPYLFNQLSDAIEWIIKNNYNFPDILHILDDFFLAAPPPRSNCLTALCKLMTLLTELNIPIAPKKTFSPSTVLEFLGILLDSVKLQARLPEDKLLRLQISLESWSQRKSCTLRELQALIGTLQFACRVVPPGRAFLRRMINLTCGITRPHHHIKLNSAFHKDLAVWSLFLKHWNGSSMFLQPHLSPPPDLQFFTDASGSIGYGAFYDNAWFQGRWKPEQTLNSFLGISIAWQEMFPVYLACKAWGHLWSTKRVLVWSDNQSVVAILNSKTSKNSRIMALVRRIVVESLVHNFTITAQHVPGYKNSIADALSRFQMPRFHSLAPLASPQPFTIQESWTQL